jgi:xylulokinase
MLHRKAIATDMGFHFGANTRILATGGASANKSILQVMADVFNAPVYTQKTTEAALLGAAYRAKYALYLAKHEAAHKNGHANAEIDNGGTGNDDKDTYYSYINKFLPHNTQRVCDPSKDSENIYNQMLMRFREMVAVMEKEQH